MALNEHDTSSPERDARLDRLYVHAGREEPPAALDAAIRAAARKSVGARPQALGARPQALGARLRRWGVPISIAAVVVVSVSLVTLMREEGAGRIEESYSPAPAEPKAPAASPPVEAQKAQDRAGPVGGAQVVAPQSAPAPTERAGAAPLADESLRARRLAEPSGARLEADDKAGRVTPRALSEVEGAASRQSVLAPETPGKKKTEVQTRDLPAEQGFALRSAPPRADQESLAAPTRESSERPLTDGRLKLLLKELDQASPDAWLKTIERLRREGRHADADALLVEFKRRFPGHPLAPQELEQAR